MGGREGVAKRWWEGGGGQGNSIRKRNARTTQTDRQTDFQTDLAPVLSIDHVIIDTAPRHARHLEHIWKHHDLQVRQVERHVEGRVVGQLYCVSLLGRVLPVPTVSFDSVRIQLSFRVKV